ncbi:MAG TPA: hypothetical protein VK582_22415 [Pyrinomonadaceae bacterium]|nr:hypothetical protein [Pyrinomonadaceae bacterium]
MVMLFCLAMLGLSSVTSSPQSNSSPPNPAIASAQKLLEGLQLKAYSQIGSLPKQYSEKELEITRRRSDERLLEAMSKFPGATKNDIDKARRDLAIARQSLGRPPLPTKYEDRFAYEMMLIIANQIEVKVAEFRRSHPQLPSPVPSRSQIVFGTLPSGNVEAVTYLVNPVEKDKSKRVFLVTFESGLMPFAEILSDIMVRALPQSDAQGNFLTLNTDRTAVEKRLDLNPDITRDFYDAVTAYVLKGGPYLSATYETRELAEPYASFSALLYRSTLVFAMGHEYGHVIFSQKDLTIDPHWPKGWHQEFFADGWGVTLSLMAAGSHTNLELTVLGARFLFLCFDLIERGISMIQTGEDIYRAQTDHPPANRRAERIARYVLASLRDFWNVEPESLNDFNDLIDGSENLDTIAGILWDRIKPKLLKLHNDGARIAPSWNALSLPQN